MPRRRHPTTKPPRPPRPPMKMPHRPRPRSPPRRISLFFRKRFVVVVEEWRRITAPELCAFEVAPLQRSCAVGAHLLQLKGLCRRGARLHAVRDLKVKHRAQVLQSSTVHRHSVAFSSAVMRPSQNDPRNLTCVPIRFIGCRSSLYFCTFF